MARKKQTRGQCAFCDREMTKGGLTKHLGVCAQRQQAIQAANLRKTGKAQSLFHLQVQDAWEGDFWLHLEMNGTTTMQQLDAYLRAIWLECCGHLSQFSIGGNWSGQEIGMGRKVSQVLAPGVELNHVYDFGTSSETLVRCVGERQGKPLDAKHPIFLMARNQLPEVACMECDQPAEWICLECQYELDESGLLCQDHADNHPHEDYGEPLPFVNSPRVGMCAYSGPAEPPY